MIINILNNAKDVLIGQNLDCKKVVLELILVENNVEISIEDNGGGIPLDVKDKIFDPYFTTKHQSQGTGIGLYMSKQIIHSHFDGDLSAVNTQIGAKFSIKLPISDVKY